MCVLKALKNSGLSPSAVILARAMFLTSYHSYPNENLTAVCQRFIAKKWLIVLHHIFLPIIGFPVVVVSLKKNSRLCSLLKRNSEPCYILKILSK